MANVVSRTTKGGNEEPAGRLSGRRSERPEDGRQKPARRGVSDGERETAAASKSATARERRAKGRPTEVEDSMPVTVRLPAELVRQLDGIVEASGFEFRDRSELIRHTLARMVRTQGSQYREPEFQRIGHMKIRQTDLTGIRWVDKDGRIWTPDYSDQPPVEMPRKRAAAARSKRA